MGLYCAVPVINLLDQECVRTNEEEEEEKGEKEEDEGGDDTDGKMRGGEREGRRDPYCNHERVIENKTVSRASKKGKIKNKKIS